MAARTARDEDLSAFQQELLAFDQELAGWIDAFGHPVRSQIVERLREGAPRTTNELAAVIETSPSTLQRSLRCLVDNRIVTKVEGRAYKLSRLA